MMAAAELGAEVGVKAACSALEVPRASFYRSQRAAGTTAVAAARPSPPRALGAEERSEVLDVLNSERFVDRAPAEVVATLLDEQRYLCSERTMYRILAANEQVRERRNQRQHRQYSKPELLATGPNQVWSWDITLLRGPTKWTYFYLYVIIDIFSRYVVGWMVAERQNAAHAQRLIEATCRKHEVADTDLVLHSDRGKPMTAKTTAQLTADLGINRSLSRPYVSDDNPFSEAQFKTVKYHPGFPARFGSQEDATAFCRSFFPWYNAEHRHGGIAMLTPQSVHYGHAQEVLAVRRAVLDCVFTRHPERFMHGPPVLAPLPPAVWINPPRNDGQNFNSEGENAGDSPPATATTAQPAPANDAASIPMPATSAVQPASPNIALDDAIKPLKRDTNIRVEVSQSH